MPAPLAPPPTSPYLQALERASKRSTAHAKNGHGRALYSSAGASQEDDGDSCWVCGNPTRATQAYCSDTCRDADVGSSEQHHHQNDAPYLYGDEPSPLLSPTLIAAADAVPALVHSRRSAKEQAARQAASANGASAGARRPNGARKQQDQQLHSEHGQVTQNHAIATTTSSKGMSSDKQQQQTQQYGGQNGNAKPGQHRSSSGATSSGRTGNTSVNGNGTTSSSSPPSSSATSSPTKTADEVDGGGEHLVDEDIDNLLLPPAIGSFARKSPGFDYAYGYGAQALQPKSPPPSSAVRAQTQVSPTAETNATVTASSGMMRKSSSQQSNRLASANKLVLSPVFAPRNGQNGTAKGAASNGHASTTTTPQAGASDVITFRRRHLGLDQQRPSSSSSVSGASSSSNQKEVTRTSANSAGAASTPSVTAGPSNSTFPSGMPPARRHSSHGSTVAATYTPASAFSPLLKPLSTPSNVSAQSSPAARTSASSAHSTRPMTANSSSSAAKRSLADSPSLAATTLSELLHKTTSRSEAAASDAHAPYPTRSNAATRADGSLRPSSSSGSVNHSGSRRYSALANGARSSQEEAKPKLSWLQRNKIAKSIFAFNNRLTASNNAPSSAAQATCGRPNCPVAHAAPCYTSPLSGEPPYRVSPSLVNGFTPLTRHASAPHSPFASPAIQYVAADPFDESFARSSNRTSDASVKRRPSLSSNNTAPPGTVSPLSASGVKPQDYSGFAGFLSALHTQKKSATGASLDRSVAAMNINGAEASPATTNAELQSNAESSESGYDAQDEEHHRERRGRTGRRSQAASTTTTTRATSDNEAAGPGQKTNANFAKPALLKEKLTNVVKASNDHSQSLSSVESSEETAGKPTKFLYSRGNAFKNSLNVNQVSTEEEDNASGHHRLQPQDRNVRDDGAAQGRARKTRSRETSFDPYTGTQRPMHNHSTSLGEGSQYIVTMHESSPRQQHSSQSRGVSGSSALLDGPSSEEDASTATQTRCTSADVHQSNTTNEPSRGRPTARRRSSGAGTRLPVVSPFTALERAQTQPLVPRWEGGDDGGRGRSRQRGSAALHRSVSPARSSSRARGRDSPRLRGR